MRQIEFSFVRQELYQIDKESRFYNTIEKIFVAYKNMCENVNYKTVYHRLWNGSDGSQIKTVGTLGVVCRDSIAYLNKGNGK